MRINRFWPLIAALLITSGAWPSTAAGQVSLAGSLVSAASQGPGAMRGNDAAYDPVNDVYLVVGGAGAVYGVFVNGSGTQVGAVFPIKPSVGMFAHYPSVEYSPHLTNGSTGSGAFLVTWFQDGDAAPGVNTVHARAVAYGVGVTGPELVLVSPAEPTWWDTVGPEIAYSETSRRFLVVWTGLDWSIKARFIDVASGTGMPSVAGSVVPITNAGGYMNAGVAWDSINDQFGISYVGWGGAGAFVGFARLGPQDTLPLGRATFGHSAGTYLSDIDFNPATGNFVFAWSSHGGSSYAELSPASALLGEGLLSSTLGGSTSLGIAFNPVSGTFLAAGQNMLWCDVVIAELDSDGAPLMTAAGINSCGATDGSYYPRVAARRNARQFGVSFAFNFVALNFQRIATASTGTGGVGTGAPPPAPTLVSPSGTIASITPTFTWNAVSSATAYNLWVTDSSGTPRVQGWLTREQTGCAAGSGTCSFTPSVSLQGGSAVWWVRARNDHGEGPWSAGRSFSVNPPMGIATLAGPLGSASLLKPTFTWIAVAGATHYYLWVTDSVGVVRVQRWYQSSEAGCSGSSTCSAAPGVTLDNGLTHWWVQAWSATGGFGPWSLAGQFTYVPLPAPTGFVWFKLTAPTMEYGWQRVTGATYYRLWVTDSSGTPKVQQWFTDAEANCSASGCTVQSSVSLNTGLVYAWVQAWSEPHGYGRWSSGVLFPFP